MNTVLVRATLVLVPLTAVAVGAVTLQDRTTPGADLSLLSIPETIYLGQHRYGEIVPYQFVVRNESSGSRAVVSDIFTPCSCTTTTTTPITIDPNEEVVLSGSYALSTNPIRNSTLALISGAPITEEANTYVSLIGSDSKRKITLKAELVAPLMLEKHDRADAWTFGIHPLYADRFQRIEFYIPGATDALPVTITTDRNGARRFHLTRSENANVLESVTHLHHDTDSDHSEFRIVQQLVLP